MSDYEDIPRQPLPYDEDVPLNGDDNKSLGEYRSGFHLFICFCLFKKNYIVMRNVNHVFFV